MAYSDQSQNDSTPLADLDHWEEFLQQRYPEPAPNSAATPAGKSLAAKSIESASEEQAPKFRDYQAEARPGVKAFYRLNHTYQTLDFVLAKKREYLSLDKRRMGIWEAMEFLNTLVDDSDPDVDFTQIEHLMQAAEAIRADGHPRWFILTGLIHDLGKILCLYGEPQWAVVGDTFPVGCAYSDTIVFPEFFTANPDYHLPEYQTPCGIYEQSCGFDNIHLSWGHDEYLYHVVQEHLPTQALAMIRYHSFYPAHKENAYRQLMNEHDHEMLEWVRLFNNYDLYSKSDERPNVKALKPFYQELIAEYFPPALCW
jgi:inositol oxygenase